jgi:hypothetical protein
MTLRSTPPCVGKESRREREKMETEDGEGESLREAEAIPDTEREEIVSERVRERVPGPCQWPPSACWPRRLR